MKCYLAILLFCLPLFSVAEAASSIGSVIAVKGASAALGANAKERVLALKSLIYLNDKIVTKEKSSIQIMLNDDSVISQGERSELVIDQYIYSSEKKKESNCSVRVLKGLFRIVTGKITKMNPDRFKVKTKMATVGIRGCEIGFEVGLKREDIYILYLPEGHSVVIEQLAMANDIVGDAAMGQDGVLTVQRHGVVVSIQDGLGLQQRNITTSEALDIMNRSVSGDSGGGDSGQKKDAGDSDVMELTDAVNDSTDKDKQTDLETDLLSQLIEPTSQPGGDGDGPSGTPSTSTPPRPPPIHVGGAPFNEWEWGIWEDGYVFYSGNRAIGATFLSAAEYDAIAVGATTYNLTGSGMAAAVVYHDASGETKDMVDTSCILDVTVGGGASPSWGGAFNFSNSDGDALDLVVDSANGDGSIQSDGHLQLNDVSSYDLTVNGDNFNRGSITSMSGDGELIQPGGGTGPISGVAGELHFEHGSAAKVDAVFGADLY
ncbi:MAG: FecR domain-containing protein [Kiritimatiellae bacterium]|nr:FecR domain-containing protein [Kiritimatiellia bacterium]